VSCIEGMELSERQLAAVFDERPRVLVAAGAGSGKTCLLVARVVHALVEQGLPVERLIAVTFTRKAGVELVSRIRSSLEACGRPDLARSLDLAATGTIHSLCRRLVKDHALESGVDPACRVLEAEAATLLKEEVGGQAW
jgi:ATP-dependent helicase/nuclease subunit A